MATSSMRRARRAQRALQGGELPPPAPVQMVEVETVGLRKDVAKRVTKEWGLSKYHSQISREQYIALLIEAQLEHEQQLREQKEQEHNLVSLATTMPNPREYIGQRTPRRGGV